MSTPSKMIVRVVFLLLAGFTANVSSSKILCLMPMCPRSHYNVFVPLVEALAERGHEVTVMSPFRTMNKPRIHEVELTRSKQTIGKAQKNVFEYLIGQDRLLLASFMPNLLKFCSAFTEEDSVKELLNAKNKYDVVIVDGVLNECALSIAPLIAKHVVTLNPTGQVPWAYTSNPVPPSFVPLVVLPYSSRMTFFQRLWNSWTQLKNRLFYHFAIIPASEQIMQSSIPQSLTVEEATKHIAITLSNTDPVLFSSRPQTPDLVLVGGMHCKPGQSIPQEFSDFIEKSKGHGAIVFSMGSFVPAKDMPPKIRVAFLAAFARLKQVVFWKFEEPITDLPPNVMITPWLPQQDLLGHSQTRLFITHGGLLSSQESVYHGVPMIGIPLFYDQIGNVARIRELGIGEALDLKNLNEDSIFRTIQRMLNDNSYSVNVQKYSSIFRDQPQKPVDRAVYWIEYVIRHEGMHHLTPAAIELNFIQYFLLDVVALATAVVVTILVIVTYLVFYLINCSERPKNRKVFEKKIY